MPAIPEDIESGTHGETWQSETVIPLRTLNLLSDGEGGFSAGDGNGPTLLQIAEPGVLTFSKLTGLRLHLFNGSRECAVPLQVGDHLFVAERLQGSTTQGGNAFEAGLHFSEQSVGEHLFDPSVYPIVQPLAGGMQPVNMLWPLFGWKRDLLLL